jgi:predicted TIM-barrel fold metal-dependent hydrolase
MLTDLLAQPKIDSHCHVFDPEAFPYVPGVAYRPAGGEIATAAYLTDLHAAYGIAHALLVQPNSGYDHDNSCMLDAIARGDGRFKGVAIVPPEVSDAELKALKAGGVVGVAHNFAMLGEPAYAGHDAFWRRLADLDLLVQVQVRDDQMARLAPRLRACGARILVDHLGRPDVSAGTGGEGFQAMLKLADTGRTWIKLSGFDKYSREPYPFSDVRPFVQAILDRYGPAYCLWASDWPHLRAARRLDMGTLMALFARSVPNPEDQKRILYDTPMKLFGFQRGAAPSPSNQV